MKVVTNRALASRRGRQATLLSLFGLSLLLVGLWMNFQGQTTFAYIGLVLGSVASWIGIALADRWVKPPRADRALEEGLKGAGRPYTLYNWILPADHVLVAPWGLTAIIVSNVDSRVVVSAGKWREDRPLWRKLLTIGRRPLGNPPRLADLEIQSLRRAFEDTTVEDVPIDAVVVFTHPGVELEADESAPIATTARGLQEWLRKQKNSHEALSSGRRRQLDLAVERLAAGAQGGVTEVK